MHNLDRKQKWIDEARSDVIRFVTRFIRCSHKAVILHKRMNSTKKASQIVKNACPSCGSRQLVYDPDNGEEVCSRCGLVVSDRNVDMGPEWRVFNPEQRKNRVRAGSPLTFTIQDYGLSTTIGTRDMDASGHKLKTSDRHKFSRLRRWDRHSKVSNRFQRNFSEALNVMIGSAYQLHLPRNVLETASIIYRKILHGESTKGRPIRDLAASCIYMACRQCDIIRCMENISKASDTTKKNLARTYRFLLQEIGEKTPHYSHEKYISKFINKLELRGETEKLAKKILETASKIHLTDGRGPSGIAGACVYIACKITGENRTQVDIARMTQVTDVTIRNRYKEILEKLDIYIKV